MDFNQTTGELIQESGKHLIESYGSLILDVIKVIVGIAVLYYTHKNLKQWHMQKQAENIFECAPRIMHCLVPWGNNKDDLEKIIDFESSLHNKSLSKESINQAIKTLEATAELTRDKLKLEQDEMNKWQFVFQKNKKIRMKCEYMGYLMNSSLGLLAGLRLIKKNSYEVKNVSSKNTDKIIEKHRNFVVSYKKVFEEQGNLESLIIKIDPYNVEKSLNDKKQPLLYIKNTCNRAFKLIQNSERKERKERKQHKNRG